MKKSANDHRQYESVHLENGLRLLGVIEPEGTKSACSLVFNTGSFDDPNDRPGFAHFTEHLLFNGNKKYPEPNNLNDFVAKHSGHANAWTATEHSNYFFDIDADFFDDALDRFVHMFVEPLFSPSALKREQEAIHAEYKLKLRDDSRRIQQVHKETSNSEHPYHKFAVGNRQTLSDLPERPVINELLEFWHEHYQAQYATACIVVNDIKAFEHAKELFKLLPSANPKLLKKPIEPSLYTTDHLAKFICIRPVKELHKLNITFALPAINHLYRNKMVSFIAHLIGHEEPGSLYDNLKREGLINELSAGSGISGQNFKDFHISFELTNLGESQIDHIITQVFSYLKFMASEVPPEYLYEEQKRLSNISFEFKEPIKPLKYANQLALNMQHYEEEDYLCGDFRMDGFDANQWDWLFEFFTPQNMRVVLVSQNIETNKEAHWYQTPYSVQSIDTDILTALQSLSPNTGTFAYPGPNPYLKLSAKIEEKDFKAKHPIAINSTKGWQCWFKQDLKYNVPKGNIYVGLDLPNGVKDIKQQAMMRLFCEVFLDEAAKTHYQAEMAGLNYNLYAHNSGITLYTSGLSNNQQELLTQLVEQLFELQPTRSRFEEMKRQLLKHWRNAESNKPISQLFSLLNSNLVPGYATAQDLASELQDIDLAEFQSFCDHLFDEVFVELLIYGNWNTRQATAISESLKVQFKQCKLVGDQQRQLRKLDNTGLLELSKKVEHQDDAALLYLQGVVPNESKTHSDLLEKALFIIVSQILAPFVFNHLRTEKQLGYLVGGGYMPLCNVPGLALYVQSHDYDGQQLKQELHNCLESFNLHLQSLSVQDFLRHQNAVSHQYSEPASNLVQQSQQYWISIGNKDYDFDYKRKIIEEINSISLQDAQNWYAGLFSPKLSNGIQVNSR